MHLELTCHCGYRLHPATLDELITQASAHIAAATDGAMPEHRFRVARAAAPVHPPASAATGSTVPLTAGR